MARTAITDNIWEQLQTTMKAHGCHQWKNDRTVMEAILWKLRTGAPWRDIPI
ncbi:MULTISPECIES: IS5/IS1182 family transposase, partial [Pseudomonadota]